MRVYDASTRISAEFGGIRDLSRHLSLNLLQSNVASCQKLSLSLLTNGMPKGPLQSPPQKIWHAKQT